MQTRVCAFQHAKGNEAYGAERFGLLTLAENKEDRREKAEPVTRSITTVYTLTFTAR